ncbi:MAG: WecB/TagA/CpsF family glycosyltransferase [Oscillospiraceae bacterium]
MSRRDILGIGFDPVTMDEAVERALGLMQNHGCAYVCTPNPEIVMTARREPELMEAINGADMVLPDGVGILWAAEKLGEPMPERVAGYDFLLALLAKMHGTVYILGGKSDTAEKAGRTIESCYPGVKVVGCCDGFITDELGLIAELGETQPDLLMVCLGASKQERWMAAHRDLPVGLMVGLGGSVDVLAGTVTRAPLWWREHKLEWMYRLLRQPKRIVRMMLLPRFVWAVLGQKRSGAPERRI